MEKTLDVVVLARALAEEAHAGQFRRDGVTPYRNHLEDVWQRVRYGGWIHQAVAWLHDTIEDTWHDGASLADRGIPISVVSAVEMLTKPEDVDYLEYIRKIAEYQIPRQVKIADIMANLSDNPSPNQVKKYSQALSILLHKEITNYWHPVK